MIFEVRGKSKRKVHEELEDKRAAIEGLHVPANFTTLVGKWAETPEPEEAQVEVPQELVMVGPWGLEPQTSTVSILKVVIANKFVDEVSPDLSGRKRVAHGMSRG